MNDIEKSLITMVEVVKTMEQDLQQLENEVQLNPMFAKYLELQKSVNEKVADTWKRVEKEMLENNIKSLKGDFGTITVAERQGWTFAEELVPAKFWKKVLDTKKITDTYRLEGKAPKGCEPYITKYIVKRLK